MFAEFFLKRPVFATVCALLIILAGAVSIPTLPIAWFPDLAPPQVSVTSFYTGANAQIVESAVTLPLEQQIADPLIDGNGHRLPRNRPARPSWRTRTG